jgi:hypothetical protein
LLPLPRGGERAKPASRTTRRSATAAHARENTGKSPVSPFSDFGVFRVADGFRRLRVDRLLGVGLHHELGLDRLAFEIAEPDRRFHSGRQRVRRDQDIGGIDVFRQHALHRRRDDGGIELRELLLRHGDRPGRVGLRVLQRLLQAVDHALRRHRAVSEEKA